MSMDVRRILVRLSICCVLISPPNVLQSQQALRKAAPSVADKERVKRGEVVFSRHCPICHLGRPSKASPFADCSGGSIMGPHKAARLLFLAFVLAFPLASAARDEPGPRVASGVAPGKPQTDQQKKGEAIFTKNCHLCHIPSAQKEKLKIG